MKLEKILDQLNSFEKNSFLKIIDTIVSSDPKNTKDVNKILSVSSHDLKVVDNTNISQVFKLVEEEFAAHIETEFKNSSSQLDIITDIIIRDGNCIMKQEWFSQLYEKELKHINNKIKSFQKSLESDSTDIEKSRKRDYLTYKECLHTAYFNDLDNNQEPKITSDEQSILSTLAGSLELSPEEIKLIKYQVMPVEKLDINNIINDLKISGVIFYSKKSNIAYVADEVVRLLRKARGKEIADKFFRRVLISFREPQINMVCKKHNIDWKLPLNSKIKKIVSESISFTGLLTNDVFKADTAVTEKKKIINDLCEKRLNINPAIKGATLFDKISNLKKYFEETEQDEKVGISINGFEKLLLDIGQIIPKFNLQIKTEFELQDENVLDADYLLDYNIKPLDIIEIMGEESIEKFCTAKNIKTRGDTFLNILDAYKDAENLYLENFVNIGFRDFVSLKGNGINLKEAELGIIFENLTKSIFLKLGFNVDETLRKKLNTKKDKIDIAINLGNQELILIECKTVKDSGYNKFSSVFRQLKAYSNLATSNDFKVIKSLLIAPDFSDEFINDCELEYELNLSLIKASSLVAILGGFKSSKHKAFPYKLLLRDVLIQEDRIIKAINK